MTPKAAMPLFKEAKQAFSVLAVPSWVERWVKFRTSGIAARGAERSGPEVTMEGSFHSLVVAFGHGGGPMMPASMKVMGIGSGGGS